MDIEKCYDSVDSRKLVEFLRRTDLLDKEYYVLSCITLKRRNNIIVEGQTAKLPLKTHFRHRFHKLCVDAGQFPSLSEVTGVENDFNFKRSLLIECEMRKKLLKKIILPPLEHIIQNNYITFNKSQFKQLKGIPQGMCLSYILSSFYYSCLEEQALGFLKQEKTLSDGTPEINCVMRLTDDYLLITNQKPNALLFIERLIGLSLSNKFRFNMKKLKANFDINVAKIGYSIEKAKADAKAAALAAKGEKVEAQNVVFNKDFDQVQNDGERMFHWIGISIDTQTLGLVPNVNVKKEAVLCTLNTNIQTSNSVLWLKKKLKSFLMNNISFYFRDTITSKPYAMETLDKLYQAAAHKYVVCCQEFRKFHSTQRHLANPIAENMDLILVQVVYAVIRSFFKYLVCNVQGTVIGRSDYHEFFCFSLKFFTERFRDHRAEFRGVIKILSAREKRATTEKQVFNFE